MASMYSGEVSLEVHEVFHDKEGKEQVYISDPVSIESENVTGIACMLLRIKEASRKPVIWKGDRFPEVLDLV